VTDPALLRAVRVCTGLSRAWLLTALLGARRGHCWHIRDRGGAQIRGLNRCLLSASLALKNKLGQNGIDRMRRVLAMKD
jgi:hypothetical protein